MFYLQDAHVESTCILMKIHRNKNVIRICVWDPYNGKAVPVHVCNCAQARAHGPMRHLCLAHRVVLIVFQYNS